MVAPLSFKDEYGYYGLRVNPSFEKTVGTVKKDLKIPLTDRRWKWYALSPYRAYLEGVDIQSQAVDYNALDYRAKNLEAPEPTTRVRPSPAGQDPAWDRVHAQHDDLQDRHAYEMAFDAMNEEHRHETMHTRAEQLRQGTSFRHNNMHPTVQANHDELREAEVPHHMPAEMQPQIRRAWHSPAEQWEAGGFIQAREFPTFEMLNYGQTQDYRPAGAAAASASTYERMREELPHSW